jgi:hypothetical protein
MKKFFRGLTALALLPLAAARLQEFRITDSESNDVVSSNQKDEDFLLEEDEYFWMRHLQAPMSMTPAPSPSITSQPSITDAHPTSSANQRCANLVPCRDSGLRLTCCIFLSDDRSLTICPPLFLLDAALDLDERNFCGDCESESLPPALPPALPTSEPSIAPVPTTSVPSSLVCDPYEPCDDDNGFLFCAELLMREITLCIPKDRADAVQDFGSCGACPQGPTVAPTMTARPSPLPTVSALPSFLSPYCYIARRCPRSLCVIITVSKLNFVMS